MSRHVVRAFGTVLVALGIFGNQLREEARKIGKYVWIGIFLNQQARRSMADEYHAQSRFDSRVPDNGFNLRGDFVQAFSRGFDLQGVLIVIHVRLMVFSLTITLASS